MKFQFNLQTQTLQITHGEYSLTIPEEWKFPYYGVCKNSGEPFSKGSYCSLGFHLDPDQPDHRILFSVHKERVQALYKVPQGDGSIIYYRREIIRPTSGIMEVEFTEWDRVEKRRKKWVQKHLSHV